MTKTHFVLVQPLTAAQLADALGCFGNDAISAMHNGTADVACIASGIQSVAWRLEEIAKECAAAPIVPAPAYGGGKEALEPFVVALDDVSIGTPDTVALWEHPSALDITVGDLRRARTAYDAIRAGAGAGVKALQWANIGRCVGWTAEDERTHLYQAKGLDRLYEIARGKAGWWAKWQGGFHAEELPSLDEAKAAAQADFERRILSCLSSALVEEADAKVGAGIYVASKTRHAPMWKAYRERGWPINSTWIDEAGEGESGDLNDLWRRCVAEASSARVLVVYREPDDALKGGWVEVGAALASGVPVYAVGLDGFSIAHDKRIRHFDKLDDAMDAAACKAAALTPPASTIPSEPEAKGDRVPDDVRRLVIAARNVAFDDAPSAEALEALDDASEAFAARVPWENEP